MKWVKRGVLTLLALAALVLLVGSLTPAGHVARTEALYGSSPETVWEVIADFETWPEWNPAIVEMTRLEDRNGRPAWLARGEWGDLPTEVVESDPPRALETFVDGGAFSGTWRYELTPQGSGTRLRVTESGEVHSVMFRAFSIFADEYASMTDFHRALAARLGHTIEIRRIGQD